MPATIWQIITGFVASLLTKATALYLLMRGGRRDERLQNAEQTIKDVQKGNISASNSSFDDKLQERYDK